MGDLGVFGGGRPVLAQHNGERHDRQGAARRPGSGRHVLACVGASDAVERHGFVL
jgi:hypothetical protein